MRLGLSWGSGRGSANHLARRASHWVAAAFLRLFLIGATLFMALVTHSTISTIGYQIQTNAFDTTQGEVVESRIHESSSSSRRGRTRLRFAPQVEAIFVVDGKQYWCDGQRFPTFSSESEAQTFLLGYSRGAAVPVHYEPGNPENASLTRGIVTKDLHATFVLLAINIGVGYGWVAAIRGHRRRRGYRKLKLHGRAVWQRGQHRPYRAGVADTFAIMLMLSAAGAYVAVGLWNRVMTNEVSVTGVLVLWLVVIAIALACAIAAKWQIDRRRLGGTSTTSTLPLPANHSREGKSRPQVLDTL